MLYCEKCRSLCLDTTPRCPGCRNAKLRPAGENDLVRLHRADQYTASLLAERFDAVGILYKLEPYAKGLAAPLYDSEVMPTDKLVLVRNADLETATELSRVLGEELREQDPEQDLAQTPLRRRLVVQTLSVLAFLALVALVVLGADAFADWLKSLF